MTPEAVSAAFRQACLAELAALKPGNVHRVADGHGMTVTDFERSAEAAAPPMGDPALSVGTRIFEAVRRTRAAVGCNTNLGIVLLCAPLAQAALVGGGVDLRFRVDRILDGLDLADAEAAFAAIRLAAPGGLGDSDVHDVKAPADTSLRAAMTAAADRDSIARQYAGGFAGIFDIGLPSLRAARERWGEARDSWAATAVHLRFLAEWPDSHVARKQGAETAAALRRRLRPVERRFVELAIPDAMADELLDLDRALKDDGLNPGTSADLTVATLFADRLLGGPCA